MKRVNLGERKQKRTEVNSTRNDITGDKLVSRHSSDNSYGNNYERIFGKRETTVTDKSWVWRPEDVKGSQ